MNRQIRLMQITHDLAIGGLQQLVLTLCRTLDRQTFHVTVLCLRDLGPLAREITQLGIKVVLLPQKQKGTDYLSFLKVARILKEERAQVIHTHNTQPLIDGALGGVLCGQRCSIIHTDHAREFPDKLRYMMAERIISHFIYKTVGVSHQTTENLRHFIKVPHHKLMTIPNGIDEEIFSVPIDRKAKKRELGVSGGGPLIGVISRLEKVKGITYLLQAMPEIVGQHPDVALLIVGEGAELASLQSECSRLGISQHVRFTGGRRDVGEILKVLDCYVLPSLSEGLPMGLLEAMASGCPVAASKVGGIPDVVQHMKTALLFSPGNPRQIAGMVNIMLGNGQLRQELASRATSLFRQHYGAQTMAARYSELYAMAAGKSCGDKWQEVGL